MFVAQHRHAPEDCPALPGRGEQLLSLVSTATAACYGVTIEAEAFIGVQHLLLLVVRAPSQESVESFLASLPGGGELLVVRARTAEEAAERGSC